MSREIQKLIEYVDLKIREIQEELEYLRSLREFLEYKVRKLSVEPSSREVPAVISEANWRRYPSGEGECCFADQLPRQFIEELREKGSKTLNGYRYVYKRLSGGREVVSRRALNGL